MEKALIQLFEQNNQEALKKKLDKANLSQLHRSIRKAAMSELKETVVLLRAIFLGSPPDNEECVNRRLETYKFAINLLQSSNVSSVMEIEIVAELLFATDQFPTSSLMQLTDMLVDLVKKCTAPGGKWLEVVTKVLSSLVSRDTVVYNGSEISGADFKSQAVNAICSSRWEQSCAVAFASMLRDVPLSIQEVGFVIEKLLRILPDMDSSEIPPIAYQLLLLALKGPRKQVLVGFLQFFIKMDNELRASTNSENENSGTSDSGNSCSALRHVEGTVILHIVYSARQDPNLGKEFIKLLKSAQHNAEFIFAPFTFSLALSLARVQRFDEQILDILKATVLRTLRQQEKKSQSQWMSSIFPHDPDLFLLISEAIKSSKYGWDHVAQGLVLFGFALLDGFGPKGAFGRVSVKTNASATDQACSLGAHILKETFKVHNSVRSKIFEEILNRIIMKTNKPVQHYINILNETVRNAPQLLLEVLSKLMEIMDHLPFLPYANAVGVLKSLTPLLKISMPLKDTLMMVLRKALFNRELEARKIAVSGYLLVLKDLKIAGSISLSQSQNSQSTSATNTLSVEGSSCNGLNSEAVCLEIMGTLKRALMQQSEVRQLLYEGLYNAVAKNNRIVDIVLELLLSQFEKFYDGNEACTQPLKLNLCVQNEMSEVILQEPVADLLTAIHLCLAEGKIRQNVEDSDDDDSDNQQSSRAMLEISLKTLTEKILKCEVEDFELDKSADFSKASTVGARNKLIATLLLGVYEALMEYTHVRYGNFSAEMCEEILSLYHKHLSVSDMMQEKKPSKASKIKKKDFKNVNSHLTMRFISAVISALFCDSDSEDQNGISLLRADKDFVEYMVMVCHQKLSKYKESGTLDVFSHSMKNKFDYLCKIGEVYLSTYAENYGTGSQQQFGDYCFYFIEGLNILFSVIFSDYQPKVTNFLEQLVGSSSISDSNLTPKFMEKFKTLTIALLTDTQNDANLKKLPPLLSIIRCLWEHLPPASKHKSDTHLWVKQLCSDQAIKDTSSSKSLLSLYLIVSQEVEGSVSVLRDIAFDIHYYLGDVEEETNISGERKYEVINAKTASSALPLVLHYLEKLLDEVDWVLSVMKSRMIASIEPLEVLQQDLSNREENEVKICVRLGHSTALFCEIVQTVVPRENLANNVLKLITRFYSILGDVAKYYLNIYKYKIGTMNHKFEKVVKLSGTQLTSQVYVFIHYIQSADAENTEARHKPKKTAVEVQKAFRGIKTVPPLIFAIEVYEKLLIQLSKKSKVNLMAYIKLSTSRDFRIQSEKVEAALEQKSDSDATDAEDAENAISSNNTSVSSNPSSSRRAPKGNRGLEMDVSRNDALSGKEKIQSSNKTQPSSRAQTSQKRSFEEQSSMVSSSKLSLSKKKKSRN